MGLASFFLRLFGRPAAPVSSDPASPAYEAYADSLPWVDRLADAVYCGGFTEDDRIAARDWATCAIGEAPRNVTGVRLVPTLAARLDPTVTSTTGSRPTDRTLHESGLEFMNAVLADHVGAAVTIYHDIQDRVCALADGAEREDND